MLRSPKVHYPNGGRLVGTIGAYDFDAEKNAIEVGMSIESFMG